MGAFVYSLFDCCRVHDQTGWDFLIQNNLRLEKQRIMLTGWSKDQGVQLQNLSKIYFNLIADELNNAGEPFDLHELLQNLRSKDGSIFTKTGILGPNSVIIYPNENGNSLGQFTAPSPKRKARIMHEPSSSEEEDNAQEFRRD